MNIPPEVKIGAITYRVTIQEDWPGHEDADGETFYDQKMGHQIFIRESLTQEAKEITFIHEALHCMNSVMNHEFLDSLSEQIYAFLVENHLV